MWSRLLVSCVAALLAVLAPVHGAAGSKDGPIAVADSPQAEKWLEQVGVPTVRRGRNNLGAAPVGDVRMLILPLQSVATPGAVKNVEDFASSGGRVLAVYWGTLAAVDVEAAPLFQLCDTLGVRPVGWQGSGTQTLRLFDPGAGVFPYGGPQVTLPSCQSVQVEPLPGTKTLARWVSDSGSPLSGARSGAVFLRGSVLYVAANLLRPVENAGPNRELFYWALQRLAPDFGPALQARDRIAGAHHACARLTGLLGAERTPEQQAEVEAAYAAIAEARGHLSGGRAARASLTADRARAAAEQLIERLRAERALQP